MKKWFFQKRVIAGACSGVLLGNIICLNPRANEFIPPEQGEYNIIAEYFTAPYNKNYVDYTDELRNTIEAQGYTVSDIITGFKTLGVHSEDNSTDYYVYEWKTIEYCDDNGNTDVMGLGTHHIVTEDESGQIVRDIFDRYDCEDETDMSVFDKYAYNISAFIRSELGQNLDKVSEIPASPKSVTTYDVDICVTYANSYCGIAPANRIEGYYEEGNHSAYYNPLFYYYSNADCANFVSQCLYYGYFGHDATWYPYLNTDGLYVGTYSWVNARGLSNYLTNTRGIAKVQATNSNTYAGNPVYWLNAVGATPSGHQMICVGKNTSGVPVVNAHNADAYHVPITMYSSDHTLYTNKIVTSCHHKWSNYLYNSTSHWKKCEYCHTTSGNGNHTIATGYSYNSSSHWKPCTVCGYKSNMTGHNFVYSGTYLQCRDCGYIKYINSANGDEEVNDSEV